MTQLIAWSVWLPFAGAVVCWLLPRGASKLAALLASGLVLVVTVGLAMAVQARGTVVHVLGGYAAPLGIELAADGLSAFMLLLTSVVNVVVGIHAASYFGRRYPSFWPLWLLLWGGLNAMYLSGDLFNLYVTLELVALSAVALVALSDDRVALASATRYLLAAMYGSLLYLLGVALVYSEHGVLALRLLESAEPGGALTITALLLLTLGLLLKTAIFPFHFWLPLAHSAAPAPVSALLSALVVKASFYLLLRLWGFTFASLPLADGAQVLAALGAAALVYGSLQALRQSRLKLLVAYSTVAQLGYLVLAMPLLIHTPPETARTAYQGLMYHAAAHGLVKAALFLAAGVIWKSYGHDRIQDLGGMATRLPLTSFVIALAAASLIGLPPSSGFVAKWWLVNAALGGGQPLWALVLLLGGLLTALYMFRLLAVSMRSAPPREASEPEPLRLALPAFALALLGVTIGLRAVELVELLAVGSPFGASP